jgi:hypothetical protein
MRDNQYLTNLQASTACYGDSFTSFTHDMRFNLWNRTNDWINCEKLCALLSRFITLFLLFTPFNIPLYYSHLFFCRVCYYFLRANSSYIFNGFLHYVLVCSLLSLNNWRVYAEHSRFLCAEKRFLLMPWSLFRTSASTRVSGYTCKAAAYISKVKM